jgi:hypothetical protein
MLRTRLFRKAAIGILLVVQVFLAPAAVGGQIPQAPEALPAPEPGIPPDWRAIHADAPKNFFEGSQHSLKLDPVSGYPRIVYGGDHLYFAQYDGAA